jgi:signal transduction histidine kinase
VTDQSATTSPPLPGVAPSPVSRLSARPTRHRLPPWLVLLGLWVAPVLFTTGQAYAAARASGRAPDFGALLVRGALFWSFWVAAAPAVAWLVRRVPPTPGRWARALTVHAAAAVATATAAQLFYGVIRRLEGGPVPPEYQALGSSLRAIVLDDWLGVGMLLYAVVAGAVVAVDLTRRYHDRDSQAAEREAELQTRLVQAQLDALRSQLNPHFLFNALNSVAMLVRAGARAEAVRVLAGLGELLRHVLYGSGAQEVPLRDELAFVERYLEIERVRFGDRLRVDVEVDPHVLDAAVPNLLLQPLVENALKHGIAGRAEGGRIVLRARADAGELRLEVADDGAGLPPGSSAAEGRGLGLANTRARLERLYGRAFRFEVGGAPERGVVASVAIPLRSAAPAAA